MSDNIAKRLIDAGFVETCSRHFGRTFYPSNNWFGIGIMEHPDAEFVRDNKNCVLSLQGVLVAEEMNLMTQQERADNLALIKSRACKYVRLKVDGKIIYKSYSGVLPPEELLSEFLKETA